MKDPKRIMYIVQLSKNWVLKPFQSAPDYYVLEQRDAINYNRTTGFYKAIKKQDADVVYWFFGIRDIVAKHSENDWIYFRKVSLK